MSVAEGTERYSVDAVPVLARGLSYTPDDLTEALDTDIASLLRDDEGIRDLQEMMGKLATMDFRSRH